MNFISLFAGIGGFDLGLERAGLRCVAQVEWDAAASGVLAHHYPNVQRFGDVKDVGKRNLPAVDIVVGGFPCQDVSVAGKRAGLVGERSGQWFEFHRILTELKPRFAVIENVPGLLSSNGGRDFAEILRGLEECGYRVAWRTLDAQYFGVAQRRRRVFIVASLRNGRCAEILFECESGTGDIEPGIEEREGTAATISASPPGRRNGASSPAAGHFVYGLSDFGAYREGVSPIRESGGDYGGGSENFVVSTFDMQRSDQYQESEHASTLSARQYKSATDLIAYNVTFCDSNGSRKDRPNGGLYVNETEQANTLTNASKDGTYLAIHAANGQDISPSLSSEGADGSEDGRGRHAFAVNGTGVRRLTPTECERLQGFPDGWTSGQSDSTRYRQLGNAVCVNVSEWLGRRIVKVIGAAS